MSAPTRIATIHLPQLAGLVAALMLAAADAYPKAILRTNEAGDELHLMSGSEPAAADPAV